MDPLHDISKPINLNYFASEQWVRTLGFLRKHFNLSDDDCKDVFQESFIILYDQICAGKLDELTSSLSTYFLAICRNKALQHLSKSKRKAADSDTLLALSDGEIRPDKVDALLALDTDDVAVVEQKEELVRDIVQDLPYPCNELLWGLLPRQSLHASTCSHAQLQQRERGKGDQAPLLRKIPRPIQPIVQQTLLKSYGK